MTFREHLAYNERALNSDLVRNSQAGSPKMGEVHKLLIKMMRQLNPSFKFVALCPVRRTLLLFISSFERLFGRFVASFSQSCEEDSSLIKRFYGLALSESN
jgi:hypothetical protein